MGRLAVAIVGAGGIGQRHLQSCCTLPAGEYEIHVVDPFPQARDAAAALVNRFPQHPEVHWHETAATLPKDLDLAVVATQADVRAAAIQAVLAHTGVRRLILEKVLFQRLREYQEIADRIARGVAAWVNCPQRLYDSYTGVKQWLGNTPLRSIELAGADWDIGCNAIHFIDLFSFWAGDGAIHVDTVELATIKPAKRAGNLHLEGTISGTLTDSNGRAVPFRVRSSPSDSPDRVITIESGKGRVVCTASGDSITVHFPDGRTSSAPVPMQSQLTARVVEDIMAGRPCGLPVYEVSRRLHEPMIRAFLQALAARGELAEPDRCPIT
jgi:predicted dehydrogenase